MFKLGQLLLPKATKKLNNDKINLEITKGSLLSMTKKGNGIRLCLSKDFNGQSQGEAFLQHT